MGLKAGEFGAGIRGEERMIFFKPEDDCVNNSDVSLVPEALQQRGGSLVIKRFALVYKEGKI